MHGEAAAPGFLTDSVVELRAVARAAAAPGNAAQTLVFSLHVRAALYTPTCEQVEAACREFHAWQKGL